jgi:hypothetical protein
MKTLLFIASIIGILVLGQLAIIGLEYIIPTSLEELRAE